MTAAAMLVAMTSTPARAWYFPEHVVIAKDAASQLPKAIAAPIEKALTKAHDEGFPFCTKVGLGLDDVPRDKPLETKMVSVDHGAECIPFTALPAIAGDHADGVTELRTVLTSKKGLELTTAAAYVWQRYLTAFDRLPNVPLERMTFVHELDVDFYFIDPGYELRAGASRAHFVDASQTLTGAMRAVDKAGAVDNALGQFVAHHYRSLALAARGQTTEALLEHGFAVHFLEDMFSAGHLVVGNADWSIGNTHVRARHDYFDAKGLRVGHQLNALPCDGENVAACWSTTGDGYLGRQSDGSDRVHAARAVKKAEIELAFALDPEAVVKFALALGERDLRQFAQLLDPSPWWTTPTRADEDPDPMTIVRAAASSVEQLWRDQVPDPIAVGTRVRGDLLPPGAAEAAMDPKAPLGTVGTSLLRPMLVELPSAQEDVTRGGEARLDHGFALQLFAQTGGLSVIQRSAPLDFMAPTLGASLGIGYRFGTYLPGRQNRSGAELNIGVSTSLHYDGRGHDGGNPYVTMLDQEVRWPFLWEYLTSYRLPLDLQKSHEAGSVILLGGARLHEMLTDPAPRLWGFEVEVGAFSIWSGRGSYPLYLASPEIRFYVGAADASAAQPNTPHSWAPTVGIMLTGGYSTFL